MNWTRTSRLGIVAAAAASLVLTGLANAQNTDPFAGGDPLVLEVTESPGGTLKVGEEGVITITVRNISGESQKDIRLQFQAQDGIEILSAQGATDISYTETQITNIQPLAILGARSKAEWKIRYRMNVPGTRNARARLTYEGQRVRRIPRQADPCVTLFFPSGERSSSAIEVKKCAPTVVIAGDQFDYNITVTNISRRTLSNIQLVDNLPDGFSYSSSSPDTQNQAGSLFWTIPSLAAGESKNFTVTGSATGLGTLTNCFEVTYSAGACVETRVVQPSLQIQKTGPAEVMLCDPITYNIVVSNPGTGTASNVVVTDNLPDGMSTTDGRQTVTFNVGSLAAGQSRSFTVNAKANRTGDFVNTAMAEAARGLRDQASVSTRVVQPVLTISKSGTDLAFVGRTIQYSITVGNTGDTVARNTILTDALPAGTSFARASDGGSLSGGTVTWNLGDLPVGESKTVSLTLVANSIGMVENKAMARAVCADAVSAVATTEIRGIPAILLEVVDSADPIEVGGETTYTIRVTNQGSAVDTNIVITVACEAQMELLSATGPTAGTVAADGKSARFAPLPSLAPKASVTYVVRARAVQATQLTDHRFAVELTSDVLTRPVNETESTHLYD